MLETTSAPTGFLGAVKNLFGTLLAIVQNRLELVMVELREEKAKAVSLLIWTAVLVMGLFMSMITVTFLVVVAFWDQRFWVLLGFACFYVGLGILAGTMIRVRVKAPFFSETLHQLKKDQEWLTSHK